MLNHRKKLRRKSQEKETVYPELLQQAATVLEQSGY